MSKSRIALGLLCLSVLPVLSSCGSNAGLSSATGVVTVDGQPVESGTIHFQPADAAAQGAGGAIDGGKFELSARTKLAPGKYQVAVQAFKKTNRVFKDPQKGQIAETIGVQVIDSPQEVELTSDNYRDLTIGFSTARK